MMISLRQVTKEYRLDDTTTITPIQDVNLEVKRGEFLMIVGRSGSGKTTLLNLCAGLIKPSSGKVLIDDNDIEKLKDRELSALRRQKMGFIFQFQSMLPNLTVLENVAIPAESSDTKNSQRAAELLGMVDLGERMNVYPRQLSAGEMKRVAIARALMNKPELLLADEPTADLDENTEISIVGLLQRIHQSGVTVVMITHNLDLVRYATRALKVEGGSLIPLDIREFKERGQSDAAVKNHEPAQANSVREAAAAAKQEPVSKPPAVRTIRTVLHPLTFGLALAAVFIGIVAVGLILMRPANTSEGTSEATPPVLPTQISQSLRIPGTALAGFNGLNTLRQYDRAAAVINVQMECEVPGRIFDFPVDLELPLILIKWTDTSFSGSLRELAPGAKITYNVDGKVSDDGATLLSYRYSRLVDTGTPTGTTLFRVALQNLPLLNPVNGTKGLIVFQKKGPDLINNIVSIEYTDSLFTTSRLAKINTEATGESVKIQPPALTLTFGDSRVIPSAPPTPSKGM